MSRRCELTGVAVQYGNNVSHSQRKTRRRFEPNIRSIAYVSELTGEKYRLKIVVKTMRTIEKLGGFDAFMLRAKDSLMSIKAKKAKKEISRKNKELVS
ncbi:50S ribosomal protein L28 [Rickettsiaceae bacterium]|jgi:large subunit ribosomal protein L28|nr:50S ribosomal protein L28 [Rickettsiaceae bacterium]